MGTPVMRPLAHIWSWEAISSLGESATETALLLRAGLCNVTQSHFVDRNGKRVMMCSTPALPHALSGARRLVALAGHAVSRLCHRMALAGMNVLAPARPILLLALPERFAARQSVDELTEEGRAVVEGVRGCLSAVRLNCDIEAFPYGRAAGAASLRRALELVGSGRPVIWGGLDSQHDWTVLKALEQADRLLTAENVDGIRPGEGAAFVMLGAPIANGIVSVIGLGVGREPHPVGSDHPTQSTGLSAALEAAVGPLRESKKRSNFWLLDNTHEGYGTQELQNVIARFGDVLGLQTELHTPLKEIGDVGAAAMPLLAALAAEAWRLGYGNDDTAVITGCSDGGARGALLLAGPTAPHGRSIAT